MVIPESFGRTAARGMPPSLNGESDWPPSLQLSAAGKTLAVPCFTVALTFAPNRYVAENVAQTVAVLCHRALQVLDSASAPQQLVWRITHERRAPIQRRLQPIIEGTNRKDHQHSFLVGGWVEALDQRLMISMVKLLAKGAFQHDQSPEISMGRPSTRGIRVAVALLLPVGLVHRLGRDDAVLSLLPDFPKARLHRHCFSAFVVGAAADLQLLGQCGSRPKSAGKASRSGTASSPQSPFRAEDGSAVLHIQARAMCQHSRYTNINVNVESQLAQGGAGRQTCLKLQGGVAEPDEHAPRASLMPRLATQWKRG